MCPHIPVPISRRTTAEKQTKTRQLTSTLSKSFRDGVTPEEEAILGIAAKDAEVLQRGWIEKGTEIHEQAHHLIGDPRVFTPSLLTEWYNIYSECKQKGLFVSRRAEKDWEENFTESYRMFFTDPEKVKTVHEGAHRSLTKVVDFLVTLELIEEHFEDDEE